jgi:hypothetical protein
MWMGLTEIVWEVMDWIHLAHDRDQWRAVVKTVMNFRVPQNAEILTSWATISFSRTLLHRVRWFVGKSRVYKIRILYLTQYLHQKRCSRCFPPVRQIYKALHRQTLLPAAPHSSITHTPCVFQRNLSYVASWCSGSSLHSFEFRTGYLLFCVRYFVIFLSISKRITGTSEVGKTPVSLNVGS